MILLQDNHGSHGTAEEIAAKLHEYKVVPVFLPANTTHLLMPLDQRIFAETKRKYGQIHLTTLDGTVAAFWATPEVVGAICDSLRLGCADNHMIGSLATTGIYPYSQEVIMSKVEGKSAAFAPAYVGQLLAASPDTAQDAIREHNEAAQAAAEVLAAGFDNEAARREANQAKKKRGGGARRLTLASIALPEQQVQPSPQPQNGSRSRARASGSVVV